MEALQFKGALVTLLVVATPNLEFMSIYPLVEYIRSPSTMMCHGILGLSWY